MTTIRECVARLQQRDQDEIVAYDMWVVEDVEGRAKDLDIPITKEQCEAVLEEMEERFDANYGLCWDVMDVYIHEIWTEIK